MFSRSRDTDQGFCLGLGFLHPGMIFYVGRLVLRFPLDKVVVIRELDYPESYPFSETGRYQ